MLNQAGKRSPSRERLDSPEDTIFYDWLLKDPKDSPFATFRFHYRSWTNLKQLNLVTWLSGTDQLGTTTKSYVSTEVDEAYPLGSHSTTKFTFGLDALDGSIIEMERLSSKTEYMEGSKHESYELEAPSK